jgi:hypothetical protein
MFGSKKEVVIRGWGKLCNEELYDLYSSQNVIWVIKSKTLRWAGHMAYIEENRNTYTVLMRKPERKRPLGRPRCRRRWY